MRYLSVCSGIEAASVAFEPLGWTPLAFAEIEAFPRAVLQHHYPDVPLFGDFTTLRHEPWIVDADVLVGGTPCQSFSVAGLRQSLDDERGNLSLEFIRLANAIDDLRRDAGREPAFILWENVPGVFSTKDNAFGAFLGGLVGSGAAIDVPHAGWPDAGVVAGPERTAAWRVLDAQFFGLAQRRRRVFVLAGGGSRKWACADALLPIAASLRGDSAPRREAREAVASVATSGFECGGTLGPRVSRLTTDECAQGAAIVADIPEVVGTLSNGAHMGGGLTGRTLTAAEYLPSLANPLTARMGKGINTTCDEWQTLIGGSFDVAYEQPYVAHTLRGNSGRNQIESDYIAHALRAEGFDASKDGTGRGTPIVTVGSLTRNLSKGAQLEGSPLVPVGFYQNEGSHGSGDNTNIAPTLKGAKHSNFAAVAFDTTQITSAANYSNPKAGDPCHPLASGAHPPAVAFDARQSDVIQYGEKTGPLDTDGHTMGIQAGMAVRRLTPQECERLQGFPDDYTLTPYRGKPAADGPRYKALGNSMAVPCMAWIGRRIQQVQALSERIPA